MSASWNGRVRLLDCDGKPGRYYVTAKNERGQTAYLLGPFVQPTLGQSGHARALNAVRKARRYCNDHRLNDFAVYAQELLSWSHLLDTVAMSFEDYQSEREEEDARILTAR